MGTTLLPLSLPPLFIKHSHVPGTVLGTGMQKVKPMVLTQVHSTAWGTDTYKPAAVMIQGDALLKTQDIPYEHRTGVNRIGPNKLRKDPLCPATHPLP